jgi:hypothetical protein
MVTQLLPGTVFFEPPVQPVVYTDHDSLLVLPSSNFLSLFTTLLYKRLLSFIKLPSLGRPIFNYP